MPEGWKQFQTSGIFHEVLDSQQTLRYDVLEEYIEY